VSVVSPPKNDGIKICLYHAILNARAFVTMSSPSFCCVSFADNYFDDEVVVDVKGQLLVSLGCKDKNTSNKDVMWSSSYDPSCAFGLAIVIQFNKPMHVQGKRGLCLFLVLCNLDFHHLSLDVCVQDSNCGITTRVWRKAIKECEGFESM
jgi:hypothetical protein